MVVVVIVIPFEEYKSIADLLSIMLYLQINIGELQVNTGLGVYNSILVDCEGKCGSIGDCSTITERLQVNGRLGVSNTTLAKEYVVVEVCKDVMPMREMLVG